eukprot:jgi/Ulvmu1/11477/UM077_0021.1
MGVILVTRNKGCHDCELHSDRSRTQQRRGNRPGNKPRLCTAYCRPVVILTPARLCMELWSSALTPEITGVYKHIPITCAFTAGRQPCCFFGTDCPPRSTCLYSPLAHSYMISVDETATVLPNPLCSTVPNSHLQSASCQLILTMLPVEGLSGIEHVIDTDVSASNLASLALKASTLRARLRSRDLLLAETQLEGRRPFTLIAVFNSKLGPAARFLQAHLRTVVRKTLQASSAGSRVSPLYSAFVKLHSTYKKQTPLHDSIFTHAECSVVLLDLLRGRLFSLSYGEGTHSPHVTSALGHAVFPAVSREHLLDNVIVEDAAYDQLSGNHHVVLGSPGLWQHVHPSKVALHAAAYAAAPQLTTSDTPHDAASSIVRCALRKVADRCAASPSARVSCLSTLAQLDRLRPGSRAETKGSPSIAPRMRGDIHADMTAATLSFTLHSHASSAAAEERARHLQHCPMCRYAATHLVPSDTCLDGSPAALDVASAPSQASSFAPSSPVSPNDDTTATHDALPAHPDMPRSRRSCSSRCSLVARTLCRISHRRRCPSSRAAVKSTALPPIHSSSNASLNAASTAAASMVSPLAHTHSQAQSQVGQPQVILAARRWELLRRHVRLMALESGLRQSMWHAAVTVVRSTKHSMESADSCSTCSSCSGEGTEASAADPVVWRAPGTEAGESAPWPLQARRMGEQVCGSVAAC